MVGNPLVYGAQCQPDEAEHLGGLFFHYGNRLSECFLAVRKGLFARLNGPECQKCPQDKEQAASQQTDLAGARFQVNRPQRNGFHGGLWCDNAHR